MRLGSSLLGAAMLFPAIAAAEAPRRTVAEPGEASLFDLVAGAETADGYQLARQVLPAAGAAAAPGDGAPAAVAASRVVFLNKNGVTLSPGANDARLNRSTIPTQQTAIPPWNVSASTWAATVSCMREIFAPFDISFVETDPGDVPHLEAVFGGSPTQFGMATSVAGLSPFTTDCAVIENSIVFTFTNVLPPDDPRVACEIQAQEVAHSYGLDHVLLASDLMTYLPYDGKRWFQNQNASCGEDRARPCGLKGSVCRQQQNSVSLLIQRLGLKSQPGDAVAPTVEITSPGDGATVPPEFDVNIAAADNTRVTMVSLYVDGVASGSAVATPYTIAMPAGLSEGTHKLRVVATDGKNEKAREITVTVREGAAAPDEGVDVLGGCAAGGGGGGGAGAAGAGLLAALGALARRRGRPRR